MNTLDDNLITIPNSQFLNNHVSSGNAGALDMMIVVKFHMALDEDIEKIKKILYEIVITSRFVFLKKPVSISVSEVTTSETFSLCFSAKAYVIDVQYEKAFETDIVTRAYAEFQKQKIRRPLIG